MLLAGEKKIKIQNGSALVEIDKIEVLRQILSAQNSSELEYDEAREIGSALIEFYQILAEDLCDD
jgi:hypothetical protein